MGKGGGGEGGGGKGEGTGGAHFSIDFPLIMENQWKAYINKSRQTEIFFPVKMFSFLSFWDRRIK